LRNKLYHILFGFSLLTLIVLAVWWIVLHASQVDAVHQGKLNTLKLEAREKVESLLRSEKTYSVPVLEDGSDFEIVTSNEANESYAIQMYPKWPQHYLRIKKAVIDKVIDKHNSRRLMVSGEGTLLMVLLFVCVIMLYRLLLAEQRSRREMQTFFHAVSHELKTPVAGVKALLETIESGSIKPEELHRYANLGLKETTRLQRLIENVLLANRINENLFSSRMTEVNIVETVERIVKVRNKIFSDTHTSFVSSCDELVKAKADPDLLQHVVRNILDNAHKYSGKDSKVKVKITADDKWCNIEICDNGIGFELGHENLLFRKFFRLPEAEQKRIKGSGLGLFIAKTLIEAVGGSIEAKSEGINKGSVFTIHLLRINENE